MSHSRCANDLKAQFMIIGPQIYATISKRGLSLSADRQSAIGDQLSAIEWGLMNMQWLIAMGKLQTRLARLIWLISGHNESNY